MRGRWSSFGMFLMIFSNIASDCPPEVLGCSSRSLLGISFETLILHGSKHPVRSHVGRLSALVVLVCNTDPHCRIRSRPCAMTQLLEVLSARLHPPFFPSLPPSLPNISLCAPTFSFNSLISASCSSTVLSTSGSPSTTARALRIRLRTSDTSPPSCWMSSCCC